jgi:hypothetical protein
VAGIVRNQWPLSSGIGGRLRPEYPHLHQFEVGGVLYGTSDRQFGLTRVSENKTTVDQVLRRPKDRLSYEYDFGESWVHDVILEAILEQAGDGRYPIIEAGRRACPPEDIGGVHGYSHFLEVLANSKHPEHQEMKEWVGGSFDPEFFNVHGANLAIHGGWVKQ